MSYSFEVDAAERPLGADEMLGEAGVVADLQDRLRRLRQVPWEGRPIDAESTFRGILDRLEGGQRLVHGVRLLAYHGYRRARLNGALVRIHTNSPECRPLYDELLRQASVYDPRVGEANHACFVFTVARLADLKLGEDWPGDVPEGARLAAHCNVGGGTMETNPAACTSIGLAEDVQVGTW